jgi:hypothetical protein
VQGKEVWRSLETDVFTVAKLRLAREVAAAGRPKRSAKALTEGNGEIRHAIAAYERQLDDSVESKATTVLYRRQLIAVIKKTWPEQRIVSCPQSLKLSANPGLLDWLSHIPPLATTIRLILCARFSR